MRAVTTLHPHSSFVGHGMDRKRSVGVPIFLARHARVVVERAATRAPIIPPKRRLNAD
ncbi:MAG: hypothetical protein ACPGWR_05655 [Ardenticatenaceae bacterium]